MNKTARKVFQIVRHGLNLIDVFKIVTPAASKGSPPMAEFAYEFATKVRRLEIKAHRMVEDRDQGRITDALANQIESDILDHLDRLTKFREQGIPVFVNYDWRGYALKIDDNWVREHHADIHTDMGGYGILAPEFTGED